MDRLSYQEIIADALSHYLPECEEFASIYNRRVENPNPYWDERSLDINASLAKWANDRVEDVKALIKQYEENA